MFRTDRPIQSSQDDVLGRFTFAEALGNAILGYREKESLVVGLFGPWGSGKTSIVNMCLEHLDAATDAADVLNRPIVIRFNPWVYSDQGQLVPQFFKQLSAVLMRREYDDAFHEAGRKLEVYGSFFEPLTLRPTVGLMASAIARVFATGGKAVKSSREPAGGDFLTVREDLNAAFTALRSRLLIVIDDVDRLNSTEIRQIFQLVKVLGDFPGAMYVLIFDKSVVLNALKKVQEGPGDEYLEKVIQIPFEVPLISKQEVEQLLFDQLHRIVRDVPEQHWDQTSWGNVYHAGLKSFFRNIRDVTRYINALRFSFALVRHDVNPVDFLALVAIQVFFPGVYGGIRDNRDLFVGILGGGAVEAEAVERMRKRCDRIVTQAPEQFHEPLFEVLKRMFPRLRTLYGSTAYGRDWLHDWRLDRRVCSPDVFDVYFRLSFSRGDLSPRDMEEVLSLAASEQAFANALSRLAGTGKISRFLEHLEDYCRGSLPREHLAVIMRTLLDQGDHFPRFGTNFFGADPPRRITRICCLLLDRVEGKEARFAMLKAAMQDAKGSLYPLVYLFAQLEQHGAARSKEGLGGGEGPAFGSADLEALRLVVLTRIDEWAGDGRLRTHPWLAAILAQWRQIGGEVAMKAYVDCLVADDQGFLDFLDAFVVMPAEGALSRYAGRLHASLDMNFLRQCAPLQETRDRARGLLATGIFQSMEEGKRLAIATFVDTIDA